MRKPIFYLILAVLISSCSHSIVRTGYQVNKSDYRNCDIAIRKNLFISDSLQKLGEIKIGESGFSVSCSEADAIEILKNEGCALNADIINITLEKRPDIFSSCYRCTAEFYKNLNSSVKVQSDEIYKPDYVTDRTSSDRKKNTGLMIGALVGGFIIGFLIF
jgi:hypothetical protein